MFLLRIDTGRLCQCICFQFLDLDFVVYQRKLWVVVFFTLNEPIYLSLASRTYVLTVNVPLTIK